MAGARPARPRVGVECHNNHRPTMEYRFGRRFTQSWHLRIGKAARHRNAAGCKRGLTPATYRHRRQGYFRSKSGSFTMHKVDETSLSALVEDHEAGKLAAICC